MTKSREAWICDYVRTPFGRYGGDLSPVRTDDLGAIPLEALISRNLKLDSNRINEIFMGCANQAGEDNRNVARMSALLAGLLLKVLVGVREVGDGAQRVDLVEEDERHARHLLVEVEGDLQLEV